MKIYKYVVIVENIFGRKSKNTYYPKTNEEYWNQTQNMIDSDTIRFYIKSIDDSNVIEEIWRGFTDLELRSFQESNCDAVCFCNKLNQIDGLSRSVLKGHRLSFSYDSRVWEIMTKKEAVKE